MGIGIYRKSLKELLVNFINPAECRHIDFICLRVKTFLVITGYNYSFETKFLFLGNALFNPVHGPDLSIQTHFTGETILSWQRNILIRKKQ